MKISFDEIELGQVKNFEGKTFDLEVEKDHSYNIQGIIVHNSVCTTAPTTGFGTRDWQLSAVEWCSEAAKTASIIADGGIRHYGDIAKSISFGAAMVMIGGMFAAHVESPGKEVEIDGIKYKEFFGSASEFQKGEAKNVEGKRELIPMKGNLSETLREMRESLQSSISYSGGKELESLKNARYVLL